MIRSDEFLFLECYLTIEEDDLHDIKEALNPVVAQWRDIGTGLGIRYGRLQEIERGNPHNLPRCLEEMLTTWLTRDYNVERFGKPTRQKLIEVIANPAAGKHPALALKFAKKHLSRRK